MLSTENFGSPSLSIGYVDWWSEALQGLGGSMYSYRECGDDLKRGVKPVLGVCVLVFGIRPQCGSRLAQSHLHYARAPRAISRNRSTYLCLLSSHQHARAESKRPPPPPTTLVAAVDDAAC